jgi:hypothetical protein
MDPVTRKLLTFSSAFIFIKIYTMKYAFFCLGLLITTFSLHAQEKQYFHDADAEVRNVGSFNSIDISSAIDLQISQGNEDAVAVSTPGKENLAMVKTEVRNGVLKIWYEQKNWFKNHGRKIRAYVSVKSLKKISSSGACYINVNGELNCDELAIDLNGASDFKGAIKATSVFVDLSGASDVYITGSAGNVNIKASGASRVKAYDFAVDNCLVDASGASDIMITVNKVLKAEASGATNIYYKGTGQVTEVRSSGASSISKKG